MVIEHLATLIYNGIHNEVWPFLIESICKIIKPLTTITTKYSRWNVIMAAGLTEKTKKRAEQTKMHVKSYLRPKAYESNDDSMVWGQVWGPQPQMHRKQRSLDARTNTQQMSKKEMRKYIPSHSIIDFYSFLFPQCVYEQWVLAVLVRATWTAELIVMSVSVLLQNMSHRTVTPKNIALTTLESPYNCRHKLWMIFLQC